jgi:hypothetical protein
MEKDKSNSKDVSQLPITKLQQEILRMQNECAGRAKTTQSLILLMTVIAFMVGIILISLAIMQFVLYKDYIFGGVYTLGSMTAFIATALYKPMQKAQNSISDLAQLQIAYLSFNSKVTIWTEYVTNRSNQAGLELDRVKEATADIETAASKSLDQIERYCSASKKSKK